MNPLHHPILCAIAIVGAWCAWKVWRAGKEIEHLIRSPETPDE